MFNKSAVSSGKGGGEVSAKIKNAVVVALLSLSGLAIYSTSPVGTSSVTRAGTMTRVPYDPAFHCPHGAVLRGSTCLTPVNVPDGACQVNNGTWYKNSCYRSSPAAVTYQQRTTAFYTSGSYLHESASASTTYSPSRVFRVFARTSTGGAVTYVSVHSSRCRVNVTSGQVTILSAGRCEIAAWADPTTTTTASLPALFIETVHKSPQRPLTVTSTKELVGKFLPLTSVGGSGSGKVSYQLVSAKSSPERCAPTSWICVPAATLSPPGLHCSIVPGPALLGSGPCRVRAVKAGDGNYLPIVSLPVLITCTTTGSAGSTGCTITGLVNGVVYTVAVTGGSTGGFGATTTWH